MCTDVYSWEQENWGIFTSSYKTNTLWALACSHRNIYIHTPTKVEGNNDTRRITTTWFCFTFRLQDLRVHNKVSKSARFNNFISGTSTFHDPIIRSSKNMFPFLIIRKTILETRTIRERICISLHIHTYIKAVEKTLWCRVLQPLTGGVTLSYIYISDKI